MIQLFILKFCVNDNVEDTLEKKEVNDGDILHVNREYSLGNASLQYNIDVKGWRDDIGADTSYDNFSFSSNHQLDQNIDINSINGKATINISFYISQETNVGEDNAGIGNEMANPDKKTVDISMIIGLISIIPISLGILGLIINKIRKPPLM